jgi:hypothetical protein
MSKAVSRDHESMVNIWPMLFPVENINAIETQKLYYRLLSLEINADKIE